MEIEIGIGILRVVKGSEGWEVALERPGTPLAFRMTGLSANGLKQAAEFLDEFLDQKGEICEAVAARK